MSEEYSNQQWQEAIQELGSLILDEQMEVNPSKTKQRKLPTKELYNLYARFYIRYVRVLTKLDMCHRWFVHPQKRLDLQSLLPLLCNRVMDLRFKLVKLNKTWLLSADPTSSSKSTATISNAEYKGRWEYLNLTTPLAQSRINSKDIVIPYMIFLQEVDSECRLQRDTFVKHCMMLKHGTECISFHDMNKTKANGTNNEKIQTILNARIVDEEGHAFIESAPAYQTDKDYTIDTYDNQGFHAATVIQKFIRGYLARGHFSQHYYGEMECIGMMYDHEKTDKILKMWNDQEVRQSEKRSKRKAEYNESLTKLRDIVRKEEGYAIAENLRSERLQWITDYIVQNETVPESLDLFYEDRNTKIVTKDDGATNVEKTASNKESRNSKNQSTPNNLVSSFESNSLLLDQMLMFVDKFHSCWETNMNDPNSKNEKFSIDIAKNYTIRDEILQETKVAVDQMVNTNLSKIRVTNLEKLMRKAASMKKEKGKKSKRKKERPLPGETMEELKNMDTSSMLKILIEHKLVNSCSYSSMILCDDDPGHWPCDADEQLASFLQKPISLSLSELRDAIMTYCVLPLCSEEVRKQIADEEIVRSILFYGPDGCGKASMAQAAASMANALFINMSPTLLANKFQDPVEATKLVHMIFAVAKDPSYAPVIIYLDECERIFAKKKDQSSEFIQFLKDLILYKNQGLTRENRVILIGCTSKPELADYNSLMWKGNIGKPAKQGFFERALYFPVPNYVQRCNLWSRCIQEQEESISNQIPEFLSMNIGFLANESEYCPASAVKACIDTIVEYGQDVPLRYDELSKILQGTRIDEKSIRQYEDFARKAAGFINTAQTTEKTKKKTTTTR